MPVRPELAARLIAELSDAVQHAHDRGVLHRDIKPGNVILTARRRDGPADADAGTHEKRQPELFGDEGLSPHLTDFGLARILEEPGEETRSGVPMGSPPYMAPEQAAGRNRDVGRATDIYALGATLYELLAGRPPFRGETATETLRLVIEGNCVAPRALRPGLPRDLETICLKCLEKDPARRYASAAALREDLERFRRGEPIRARSASCRARAVKWARRRPMHALAWALAALVVAGLVGGMVYRGALLQAHGRALEREAARADANARLARRHLLAFQLRQAREALDARQVEHAQDILSALQAERQRSIGPRDPSDPGFAWRYLMKRARRDLVILSDSRSERVHQMALSPDGRSLATADEKGTVSVWDAASGARLQPLAFEHDLPLCLAYGPDGRSLAVAGKDRAVRLWDPLTAQELLALDAHKAQVNDLAFSPDGSMLASCGHDGSVRFWRAGP